MVETGGLVGGAEVDLFDALYRSEHLRMVRLARLMVGSQPDAEQIVHDAFVRLHGAWDRVEQPGAYLRTIVVNLCRTHLGRRSREDLRSDVDTGGLDLAPDLDETWQALCRLPERYRVALALRFYEDLPDAEIARVLGCRVGTVRSLVHRGLDRLREEVS